MFLIPVQSRYRPCIWGSFDYVSSGWRLSAQASSFKSVSSLCYGQPGGWFVDSLVDTGEPGWSYSWVALFLSSWENPKGSCNQWLLCPWASLLWGLILSPLMFNVSVRQLGMWVRRHKLQCIQNADGTQLHDSSMSAPAGTMECITWHLDERELAVPQSRRDQDNVGGLREADGRFGSDHSWECDHHL